MEPSLQVVLDAADPHAQVRFWAAALGYRVEDHHDLVASLLDAGHLAADEATEVDRRRAFRDVATAVDPAGRRPRLLVQHVAGAKVAKNRMHLDLQVGADARVDEVARLVGLGARELWTVADRGPTCTTLADPEGNEFCVSAAPCTPLSRPQQPCRTSWAVSSPVCSRQ